MISSASVYPLCVCRLPAFPQARDILAIRTAYTIGAWKDHVPSAQLAKAKKAAAAAPASSSSGSGSSEEAVASPPPSAAKSAGGARRRK